MRFIARTEHKCSIREQLLDFELIRLSGLLRGNNAQRICVLLNPVLTEMLELNEGVQSWSDLPHYVVIREEAIWEEVVHSRSDRVLF